MDEEKSARLSLGEIKRLIKSNDPDSVALGKAADKVFADSLNEESRRLFEKVSLASSALSDSLGRLSMPDVSFAPPPSFEIAPFYDPPLNLELVSPAFETNERLDKLNTSIAALVEVAQRQAELTQAIYESTKATLASAVQSSAEAHASTKLARSSMRITLIALIIAILAPIFSVAVTIYIDNRNTTASNARMKNDGLIRQREVNVLDDISRRLAEGSASHK